MEIRRIDPSRRRDVRRFVEFPFQLRSGQTSWAPPLRAEERRRLDRRRHPFYEHSDAAFFVAIAGDRTVGRIGVSEHRRFNEHHRRRDACFHGFEVVDDAGAALALFDAAEEWARARDLERLIGPRGLLPVDGFGIQITGFDQPANQIAPSHPPYYARLVAEAGFDKETDYLTGRIDVTMRLDPEVVAAAEQAAAEGGYRIETFAGRRDLRRWALRLGEVYNRSFSGNWEFAPLTAAESHEIFSRFAAIARPDLMLRVMHGGDLVGFLLNAPDVSDALSRIRGDLFPLGWLTLRRCARRATNGALFGVGLVPEHRGTGANLLLYAGFARLGYAFPDGSAALGQIDEANRPMMANMEAVGVPWTQRHRVYRRSI